MANLFDDTICAIATPHGIGGIAVIRLSGPEAFTVAAKLWHGASLADAPSHTAHFGTLRNPADPAETLDEAVATVFRGPHSYTGQDTVEFSVHGSEYVQTRLLQLLIASGARLAQAGEFTRRAFTAGHLDLAQAEAVADLIASDSEASHRIAMQQMRGGFSRRLRELREKLVDLASLLELELDFSEEEVEFASREQLRQTAIDVAEEVDRLRDSFSRGAAIKNGIAVAIAGVTNAGKSSLLNALLGEERAIVSDIHGTTRDTVEDTIAMGEYRFRFIDTAGIRNTNDTIEQLGIERSHRAIGTADIVITLLDATRPMQPQYDAAVEGISGKTRIIAAINKTDIAPGADFIPPEGIPAVSLSAKTGKGIDTLRRQLIATARTFGGFDQREIIITNLRHAQALDEASLSIRRVIQGIDTSLPGDLIAQDLRQTLHILGTILGTITTTDLLSTIFSRFCVGK